MPTSSPSGKAWIQDQIQQINRDSAIRHVLDIGIGEGTYANKYRSILPGSVWIGIEAWQDYVGLYQLDQKYDQVIVDDARRVDYGALPRQDLAFAGDVLEHMSKEEAENLVSQLLDRCRCLFVSIPIVYSHQDDVNGNPYERHIKPDWTDREFLETFGSVILDRQVEGEIGVYLLSRDPSLRQVRRGIPKIMHFVWVGDENRRPDNCIDTWRRHNPEWTVKVWGNEELFKRPWHNGRALTAMWNREKCGVADLMRYEILYNEGGLALDADSVCQRPLPDWLFDVEAFSTWENELARPGLLAVGVMAAKAANPFFRYIIDDVWSDKNIGNGPAWATTGPVRLTDCWKRYRYANLTVWPSHFFLPKHHDHVEYTGSGPVFASQVWGSTHSGTYDNLHQRQL